MKPILQIYDSFDLLIAAMHMMGIDKLNNENAVAGFFAFRINDTIQVHIGYKQPVPKHLIEAIHLITAPVPRYAPGTDAPAIVGESGPELIRVLPGSLIDPTLMAIDEANSIWTRGFDAAYRLKELNGNRRFVPIKR